MSIKINLRKVFTGVALATAMGGSFSAGYIVRSSELNENVVVAQAITIVEPPTQAIETARGTTDSTAKEETEAVKPVILTADEADLLYKQPRSQFQQKAIAAGGEDYSALGAVINQTKPPVLTADEADLLYKQPRIQIQWYR